MGMTLIRWGKNMVFQVKFPVIMAAAFLLFPGRIGAQAVTVDFSKTKQVIDGFGGSSAWEGTFSDALMDAIYKNGNNQLGFTILRNRIDPHAGWASDKSNSAKAKARGATVFATPWSPPESLKTNGNTVKGGIITSKFAGFVTWMKSYLAYCGEENIDIVSIENEPDYAEQITYEGCTWTAANFKDFCKTYAPQIGKPIMMPESFNFNFALSDPTLDDADAAKNVSYIGGHLYGSQPKTYTKAINLGKHVWETEWNSSDMSASGCMTLAKQVLDCMHNSMNAYVYWWMTASGNGVISTSGTPNKYGYVLSMFARWVRPGYYCVDATYNPQSGVYVVAFKGAQNVTVAVNNSTSSKTQSFTYVNATVTSVQKYTASQSKNAVSDGTITAANNSFSATLDAQSVTTLVSEGSTALLPYKNEGGRYAMDRASIAAAQSESLAPFIYLINGKRGHLPSGYDLRRLPQGIYIVNGKVHVGVGSNNQITTNPEEGCHEIP
jgi:glucuronoarabinoxylan endo-1,4-beta-xylanase